MDTEIVRDTALRRVYDELREKQAQLIEGALDDNEVWNLDAPDTDADDEDDDLGFRHEQPVMRLSEFESQITDDLEILETDVIDRDATSNRTILRTEQFRALNAVIADALARYDYNENELMAYMFSVMGVTD